jgi:hypothetical protein
MSQHNGMGVFKVNILLYVSTVPLSQVRYLLIPLLVHLDIETIDPFYVFLRVNLLYDKIWNVGNYCVNFLALLL